MEEISLNKLGLELQVLKKMMQRIQEAVLEDELEVSEEVIAEVKRGRMGKGTPHEEVVKEFCND